MRTRVGAVAPWIALCLMAGMLTACGGGSSSSTGPSSFSGGGGSGATIQGQVRRNGSAALHESAVAVVLRAALGVGIAEAAVGDPVVGFTVNLLSCTSPAIITSTTTDTSGNFQFTGLAAGCYVVQVVELPPGTLVLGTSSQVVVGDGDIGTVVGTARVGSETSAGSPPVVTIASVNVVAANVNDLLQNNAQVCHAISIATAAGVNPLDVIKARQAGGGHGWGQIAHQFGVPPSVLGNQSCTETQISDTVALAGGGGKGKGNGKGNGKGKGKGNNS
jgi:hypothetical protein